MESVEQENPMQFVPGGGPDGEMVNRVLGEEVQRMSSDRTLPEPIQVCVETCGEANGFYDPGDISITFCIEFEDHLRELFDSAIE